MSVNILCYRGKVVILSSQVETFQSAYTELCLFVILLDQQSLVDAERKSSYHDSTLKRQIWIFTTCFQTILIESPALLTITV